MNKKFELALETEKTFFGIKMFRIRALLSFRSIIKGDLGGYVESEKNLSQVSGNAWVYGDARVYGNAWVSGNARVYGNAQVCSNAWVYGDARVYGNAWVSGNAQVYGNAQVCSNTWVSGNAWVYGDAQVYRLYQVCNVTNLKWNFTSLPKGVQVGCHFKSMKEWKEKHIEIGKENGLSPELAKAYYDLMKSIRKIQRLESTGK
jgi:hypothetical protein